MNRLNSRNRRRSGTARLAIVVSLLLIAAICFLAGEGTYSSTHEGIISYIDGQKDNVTVLALSATTLSAAISTIPDDSCTPIADKLADISVFLMLALGVLYLEKFLLPIVGIVSFHAILPGACLLLIPGLLRWKYRHLFRGIAIKLIAFTIALLCIIPTSVWISETINDIYGESIQSTLHEARQIEESASDGSEENQTLWNRITGTLQGTVNSIKEAANWAKSSLSRYIEATVVLTVTNCVIPILTILFYYLLIKGLLGIHWEPYAMRPRKKDGSSGR